MENFRDEMEKRKQESIAVKLEKARAAKAAKEAKKAKPETETAEEVKAEAAPVEKKKSIKKLKLKK